MRDVTHAYHHIEHAATLAGLDPKIPTHRLGAFLEILQLIENHNPVIEFTDDPTKSHDTHVHSSWRPYTSPADITDTWERCDFTFPLRCVLHKNHGHVGAMPHRFDITTIPGETVGGRSEHDQQPDNSKQIRNFQESLKDRHDRINKLERQFVEYKARIQELVNEWGNVGGDEADAYHNCAQELREAMK